MLPSILFAAAAAASAPQTSDLSQQEQVVERGVIPTELEGVGDFDLNDYSQEDSTQTVELPLDAEDPYRLVSMEETNHSYERFHLCQEFLPMGGRADFNGHRARIRISLDGDSRARRYQCD